jgi:hypothetical protein
MLGGNQFQPTVSGDIMQEENGVALGIQELNIEELEAVSGCGPSLGGFLLYLMTKRIDGYQF